MKLFEPHIWGIFLKIKARYRMKNHQDRFSTCSRLPDRFYRNVHPIPPSLTVLFFRRSPCYAIPSTVGKIPWRRFRIFVTSTSPCILWKRVSKNLWLTSFERCWRWWFFGQIIFSLFLLFFGGWALSEKSCFKNQVSWFLKNVTPFLGGEICVFFVFFFLGCSRGLIVKLAPFF